MKRFFLVLASLLTVMSACAPQDGVAPVTETAVPAQADSLFAYDRSIPFDIKINSQTDQAGVTVTDLSYAAHDAAYSPNTGGRTLAYLVRPKGKGPFAGVIYLHWFGNITNSRKQYLNEAISLAQHGVVCLLPQGFFPWMAAPTLDQGDRAMILGQTIEIRRAVDFLLTQPDVDADRLGMVGHDYGAMYAGITSGIDQRLKSYVLIAGTPSFDSFLTFGIAQPTNYSSLFSDLDPILYVAHRNSSSIFFQFAKRDEFIPQDAAARFYAAASEPKSIQWYDDSHRMTIESARQDRQAWLIGQLALQ